MSDYNSGYTGARVVELLDSIPNLAKADLSNAMTVSLRQNGYAKFNNGLLIQWGTRSGGVGFTSLYLPISFADTYYNVQLTGVNAQKNETVIYSPNVFITKTTSYFQFGTLYNAGGDKLNEWTSWPFCWFAIGRWK